MSLNSTKNCSVPELLYNFKMFLLLAVFAVSSINVFAQTSTTSSCDEFASGPAAWPHVLNAALIADGESSQAEQTISINVTSLPAEGANWRVYKTGSGGGPIFTGNEALQLGPNHKTVPAVDFNRAVKFQFNSGDVEFDVLTLNGVQSGCVPLPTTSTVSFCGEFVDGSSAWPRVLNAALLADGASSQLAQNMSINVTSLPEGGANFRVYKTTENGSDFFGTSTPLVVGLNTLSVAAVDFDRAVKFQFDSGDWKKLGSDINGEISSAYTGVGGSFYLFRSVDTTDDGLYLATGLPDGKPNGNGLVRIFK